MGSFLFVLFPIRLVRLIKMFFVLFRILFLCGLFFILVLILPRNFITFIEETPFECGLNHNILNVIPFSYQFFLIAVLFLIFDIEISLMLPFSIETWSLFNSNSVWLIIVVLLIGVLYEWKNGKINWTLWMISFFCIKLIFHYWC